MKVVIKMEIIYEMSKSEELIMEYLWTCNGKRVFNDIMEYLNGEEGKNWKKQTVNTFIKRLTDKGLVSVSKNGTIHEYSAAVTRNEYEKGRAKSLLDNYYSGSFGSFLSALTGGKRISPEFADELRNMVDFDEER
jgi:predicted transcriptional regulator